MTLRTSRHPQAWSLHVARVLIEDLGVPTDRLMMMTWSELGPLVGAVLDREVQLAIWRASIECQR